MSFIREDGASAVQGGRAATAARVRRHVPLHGHYLGRAPNPPAVAARPTVLCQTANAPPARPVIRDLERARCASFSLPRERGIERREALGAGSARTLTVPTGTAWTPDEASRTQIAGCSPLGALPRHFYECGSPASRKEVFPSSCSLRVVVPAGSEPAAAPSAQGASLSPQGPPLPAPPWVPSGKRLVSGDGCGLAWLQRGVNQKHRYFVLTNWLSVRGRLTGSPGDRPGDFVRARPREERVLSGGEMFGSPFQ